MNTEEKQKQVAKRVRWFRGLPAKEQRFLRQVFGAQLDLLCLAQDVIDDKESRIAQLQDIMHEFRSAHTFREPTPEVEPADVEAVQDIPIMSPTEYRQINTDPITGETVALSVDEARLAEMDAVMREAFDVPKLSTGDLGLVDTSEAKAALPKMRVKSDEEIRRDRLESVVRELSALIDLHKH